MDTLEWMRQEGLTTISVEMLEEYSEAYVSMKLIREYLDFCETNEEQPSIEQMRKLLGG